MSSLTSVLQAVTPMSAYTSLDRVTRRMPPDAFALFIAHLIPGGAALLLLVWLRRPYPCFVVRTSICPGPADDDEVLQQLEQQLAGGR